ncbi:MAG TPA: metallophosphoesterase, partial [Phycisphaerae bacterium]|nr:metallophosphoesterase [Phycisphaerae bacterium]
MPNVMAEIFRQAAAANRHDPHREGNVVVLEGGCEVLVTGDIHGNRTALAKVIAVAQLDGHPQRRLILQEIIHGPVDPRSGHDRSIDLLLRSARLKIAHPEQVFFILGNHDIAQVSGGEITKDGRRVCEQ